MFSIADNYLRKAKSDLEVSLLLLDNKSTSNTFFHLSQSFEKVNKYLLISIRIKNSFPNIVEEKIEEEMLKYGHNKKQVVKEIINYFKTIDQNEEFDKINDYMSKIISSFNLFSEASEFCKTINEDIDYYNQIKENKNVKDAKFEFLQQKFIEKEIDTELLNIF